jgi:2-polyprenyl-3-methyl-5-hydroxy-6-metoxy-1,4-benzoquinol methylase
MASRGKRVKTFSTKPEDVAGNYRPCPVCKGEEPLFQYSLGASRFCRCSFCGHLYQYPVPEAKDLHDRYGEEYLKYELENEEAFLQLMKLTLQDFDFFRIAKQRNISRGRFLDVGCATGGLLYWLKGMGWTVQGVEVCKPAAEYARKERGLTIHTTPLEKTGLPSNRVDVVHASHLIEHLEKPREFLDEVHRVLLPGGVLLLTTPNEAGLQARLYGSGWRSVIEDHIHLFKAGNLARLIEESGFRIMKKVTWGGIPKGMAPFFIKRAADYLAKHLGFGDVIAFLAEKRGA